MCTYTVYKDELNKYKSKNDFFKNSLMIILKFTSIFITAVHDISKRISVKIHEYDVST